MTIVLNRKVVLEARVRSADGAGGAQGGWTALGEHWAHIEARTGRIESGEEYPRSRVPYRITIRSVPPGAEGRPEAGQRFREGTRAYAIRAVADAASDTRFLTVFADEEGVA